MDTARKKKIQADMFERSYLEWNLMRSLAFGERDWILICAVMFLISDTRDFLTWSGFICMWLGIFFLGPTYGFFIHLVSMSSWSTTPAIMQQQQQPHQQQKQTITPLAPVTR